MKLPLASLPLRQKELWVKVITDAILLLAFLAAFRLEARDRYATGYTCFILSYLIPSMYRGLKSHTTDDTRTDERDKYVRSRGRSAGYFLLTGGVWWLLWRTRFPSIHSASWYFDTLLMLWLGSRLVTNSVQLRIYNGHEAWWPDRLIAWHESKREQRMEMMERRLERIRIRRERNSQ